ncbi:MAG: tRNA (adenosine(37)-N6)-dimethylallyltransferase MiaA [Pseudomonadota bacterium]
MNTASAVCLMGPTASGKTELAVALCKRFPFEVVSVDSALVYREMDIGTAKPDRETLARVPHRLIDIRDPEEAYSAGEFVRDAAREMQSIREAGRVPLLVGGTMLYFRALTEGIAELPEADAALREALDKEAAEQGWPALHAELAVYDPSTAARIDRNDRQRIQRALEVFRLTGTPLSSLTRDTRPPLPGWRFIKAALNPSRRADLHTRIERRLRQMVTNGFAEELEALMTRPGLERDSPAMRAVGYRQYWGYLAGEYSEQEAFSRALYATRQLAKRQITWLRREKSLFAVDPLEAGAIDAMSRYLAAELG